DERPGRPRRGVVRAGARRHRHGRRPRRRRGAGRDPVSDRIRLLGVRARGHHGVLPEEKRDGQDFVVDVILELDLAPAGTTDDLALTIDYAEVGADVVARIEGPSLDLIESLAEQVAADALARPGVRAVEVTVH